MENLWTLKALPDKDIVCVTRNFGVSQLVATLLAQRGIKTFEEAKQFFRLQLSDLTILFDEGYG